MRKTKIAGDERPSNENTQTVVKSDSLLEYLYQLIDKIRATEETLGTCQVFGIFSLAYEVY